jgi:hypothetical protein
MANPNEKVELSVPIGVLNVIMRAIYIERPEAFISISPDLAKALMALLPESELRQWAARELAVS